MRRTIQPVRFKEEECSDSCVWRLRFKEIERENQQFRNQFKETIGTLEAKCEQLEQQKTCLEHQVKQLSDANKFIAQKARDFKSKILPLEKEKDNSLDREDSGSIEDDHIFATDRPVAMKAKPRGFTTTIGKGEAAMSLFLMDKMQDDKHHLSRNNSDGKYTSDDEDQKDAHDTKSEIQTSYLNFPSNQFPKKGTGPNLTMINEDLNETKNTYDFGTTAQWEVNNIAVTKVEVLKKELPRGIRNSDEFDMRFSTITNADPNRLPRSTNLRMSEPLNKPVLPESPKIIPKGQAHIMNSRSIVPSVGRSSIIVDSKNRSTIFRDNSFSIRERTGTVKEKTKVHLMNKKSEAEVSDQSNYQPSVSIRHYKNLKEAATNQHRRTQKAGPILASTVRGSLKKIANLSKTIKPLFQSSAKGSQLPKMCSTVRIVESPAKKQTPQTQEIIRNFESTPQTRNHSILLPPDTLENRFSSFLQTATKSVTKSVAHLLSSVKKQVLPDPAALLGDLSWLARQLDVSRLPEEHFFETYLVVGLEEISSLKMKPKVLLSYPSQEDLSPLSKSLIDNQTSEVIADFCFPNGVAVRPIDYIFSKSLEEQTTEVQDIIQDQLYKQINLRENMFSFTISTSYSQHSEETAPFSLQDNYINCMCVWFNDLVRKGDQLYQVQKAVCVCSTNHQFFALLQEMLWWIFMLTKNERTNYQINNEFSEVQSAIDIKIEQPSQDIKAVLKEMYNYIGNHKGEMIRTVSIGESPALVYTFPTYPKQGQLQLALSDLQFDLQEHHWHCPTLFSLLSPHMLCKILTAVLLERSLVFVHDNLSILTSVVLALKTLIRPFQWCYMLVPVLPTVLLETLELPQPLLVGITLADYYDQILEKMSDSERKMKTWIFLDPVFSLQEIKENLEIDDSGIQILWGCQDGDFQKAYRSRELLRWCNQLQTDSYPHFKNFLNEVTTPSKNITFHSIIDINSTDEVFDELEPIQGTPRRSNRSNSRLNQSNISIDSQNFSQLMDRKTPVVLVASESQLIEIDMIVVLIAKTLKDKILDIIPKLILQNNSFDQDSLADNMESICHISDAEFMRKFAYTQMFCCMIDDYIQQTQL